MPFRLTGLIFGLLLGIAMPACAADQPGTQRPERVEFQIKVELNYLLYLPQEYEQKPAWPLLVFLHGAGERGNDLELVKVHGPPKLIAAGKHFPAIVVSPQCPEDRTWRALELIGLLEDLSRRYKVDADRIYVTGLSMGGFGTWELAANAADRLAAIAPICGGGEPFWTRSFANLPVWAFHGAKDTAVTLDRSQVMIDALKAAGGSPKFTIYPEAGHDSWTETYNSPAFYEWLFAQKRAPRK
ncbi:MAG: dienelactone hydrolase family protein [Planctomycetales bacterium]